MTEDDRFRISFWQILLLVFTLSLCVSPFNLPGLLMGAADPRAAWQGMLPALCAALWGTWAAAALSRRFHGRALDRTLSELLGPPLGVVYTTALAALMLAGAAVNLQVFATSAQSTILPRLPHAYVALMVGSVGTYAATSGPEAIGRCANVLAPFLLAGLAAMFLPLPFEAHLSVLLPLKAAPWRQWRTAPFVVAAATIRGFLPLLVAGPMTAAPVRTRPLMVASTVAWALVAASVVLPVAIFDAPLVRQLNLPFLSAEATLTWRWLPARDLVPLTLLVWSAITLIVYATYLWASIWLLRRLIPSLPAAGTTLVGAVLAVTWASVNLSEAALHFWLAVWSVGVLVLGLAVPTGLCALRRGTGAGAPVLRRTSGEAGGG